MTSRDLPRPPTQVPWLTPRSLPEQAFAAVAFSFGMLFYAFLVGETSAIAMQGMKREVRVPPLPWRDPRATT